MLHDFMPVMKQAQELMRQFDSVRPFIEAARRNDQLMRQAAATLAFTGPAFELANNFTAASEAMKDALRVDSSTLNIGKTLAEQLDIASSMRSALQIHKTGLDALRTARFTSDAIQSAMRVDTSALSIATKALSRQAETAAAMKAALEIDTSALEWAKTVAPQFDTVRPLVAALQRAVPELPKLEISSVVQEAVRSLSAMNIDAAAGGRTRAACGTHEPDAEREPECQHRHAVVSPSAAGGNVDRLIPAPFRAQARAVWHRVHRGRRRCCIAAPDGEGADNRAKR